MRAHLRSSLKDPGSAQVENLRGPSRVTMKGSMLGPPQYGWGICANVNAKNSFGGYVGFRPVAMIWRDGRVLTTAGGSNNSIDNALAQGICQYVY